jgi:formylglycine-generating enzyme
MADKKKPAPSSAAAEPEKKYRTTIRLPGEGRHMDEAGNLVLKIDQHDVGGEYFAFEGLVPPGAGIPLHLHRKDHEILYVIEGTLALGDGEKVHQLRPGSVASVVRNGPHSVFNHTSRPARALFLTVPGEQQGFFEQLDEAKTPEQLAELCRRFATEFIEAPAPQPGEVTENGIGMELVGLPAGEFDMGSPESDPAAQPNERPQHRVRITKPFQVGRHPVTVGQFRRFVRDTGYVTEGERSGQGSFGLDLETGRVEPRPYYDWRDWLWEDESRPSGFVQTDRHPVVCVSWADAKAFCEWLSGREGARYRLPTEAEWEYAARAGTTSRYYFGDEEDGLASHANMADRSLQRLWVMKQGGAWVRLPPYAKPWDDGFPFTAPVGSFTANPWRLFDVLGNVGEWCADWYDGSYYQQLGDRVAEDPQGPEQPEKVDVSHLIPGSPPLELRVVRGGVWLDPATGLRCADRSTQLRHPVHSAADIGFRVVREIPASGAGPVLSSPSQAAERGGKGAA